MDKQVYIFIEGDDPIERIYFTIDAILLPSTFARLIINELNHHYFTYHSLYHLNL